MQTKKDMIKIYQKMGIQEGSIVCLQANTDAMDSILGKGQTCIEALMHVVTDSGCIFVPTFDDSCLDPSCLDGLNYDQWKEMRKDQPGYRSRLTGCDGFGIQFLRNPKVRRSKHPVYSFAFWGTYEPVVLETKPDFPICLDPAFWSIQNKHVMNILIGYDEMKSVLPYTIAKKKHMGTWIVQRAKVGMSNPPTFETFLNLSLENEEQTKCLKACVIQHYTFDEISYLCLQVDDTLLK